MAKDMLLCLKMFLRLLVIVLVYSIIARVDGDLTCSNKNMGRHQVYQKLNGDSKILVCLNQSGKYKWKFLDGTPTLGEIIEPAKDCSDIVENVPDAKDGFYWIVATRNKYMKVWCDVNSDGGGLMLVGKTNGPAFWSVPSNSTPVDPNGEPQWSSEFGTLSIQHFAVQVSTTGKFAGTKAFWMYSLRNPRSFGNLFGVGKNLCTDTHSGIGNINYVKDIMTETVVTKQFKCSKFGPHYGYNLGWGRMNYCFKNKCPHGYAFFRGVPVQFDIFGSFSYSTTLSLSGVTHNATAFVGCDNKKCCACYGPKGGRGDYCGPACSSVNGGTVTENVTVWYWIRTKLPKRVWKQCMEFLKKDKKGNVETYFIDKKTGIEYKGSCSDKFQALLNEGTLSVENKNALENLPLIPGLLSYRKDNEELYVNNGSYWQALGNEKQVENLEDKVEELDDKNTRMERGNGKKFKKLKTVIEKLDDKNNKTNEKQEKEFKKLKTVIEKLIDENNKTNEKQEKEVEALEKKIENLERRINMQYILSCTTLKKIHPSFQSGLYKIYPSGYQKSPLNVYCDMSSRNGIGVTQIGHNSEIRTKVDGYAQSPGSYSRKIVYKGNIADIVALTNVSKHCEQFIKWECLRTMFIYQGYSWWVSRQGNKMTYWGGATGHPGKCACGMTNSCAGGHKCNCDNNDGVLRKDEGYLTDKNTLPVSELRLGDTDSNGEYGYYTLGKLLCWG